jgi:hypothetical protein
VILPGSVVSGFEPPFASDLFVRGLEPGGLGQRRYFCEKALLFRDASFMFVVDGQKPLDKLYKPKGRVVSDEEKSNQATGEPCILPLLE